SITILVFANEKESPILPLLIPSVGWFIVLLLQLGAVALGSAEAVDEEEGEGHRRWTLRWRLALFIGAIAVWLLTAVWALSTWSGRALPSSRWEFFVYCVGISLGSFGAMILLDTRRVQRSLRLGAMRTLLADHMMDELEAINSAKPKRKRDEQTAV